ncbi:methylmalonyl Co-A mutase-associated GTPase MeaB, partial [candidate division KSB1 bacterium]
MTPSNLLSQFFSGSRRALAKIITAVENESPEAPALLDAIYAKVGRAYRLGITG